MLYPLNYEGNDVIGPVGLLITFSKRVATTPIVHL
jgi:hypothetical protein